MHYNNDRRGHPENPADVPTLHFCHCGQPLDTGECECENCAAEWQEFITDSDRYALGNPGALM